MSNVAKQDHCFSIVMAGPVPAVHVLRAGTKWSVDARPKAGHDEEKKNPISNI